MFAQCKDNVVFFYDFQTFYCLRGWVLKETKKTLLEYLTIGKIYHGNSDVKMLVNITAVFALVTIVRKFVSESGF